MTKLKMSLTLIGALAAGTLAAPLARAVSVDTPKLPQNAFILEIAEPNQVFLCRDARKITHVSLQKYVSAQLEQGSRVNTPPQYVTEMTVDFESMPGQVRIYAMEEFDPLRLAEKVPQYKNAKARVRKTVNAATDSNAADVAQYLVVKTYPYTTHAKTIEFRVPEAAEVEALFKIFRIYYSRDRLDYRYFGAITSQNAKTTNQKTFLCPKAGPLRDWSKEFESGSVSRNENEKIVVSGLSGLRFRIGMPSAVATEIERRDVNKE